MFRSRSRSRSSNVTAKIFSRQTGFPAPGTSISSARQFYENIVPSHTVYDVECPDYSFRKFTEDGRYLISFSRNNQEIIVYRPIWPSFPSKEEHGDPHDLPEKAKKFESFFTQLYSINLASIGELVCKEFFLYLEINQFGLFATSTTHLQDAPVTGGAVPGVPAVEKITFHLVRLEDGAILDERMFSSDYVNLLNNNGVFLYEDLLAIVSLRYQRIHIVQIRDSGNLVDVRTIGDFCREDDELFLHSNYQVPADAPHGLGAAADTPFLTGIKQRLLSFVFKGIWNEDSDPSLTMQSLKKRFYFHFQDYVDLIMWKVQFLDRHHLLIKMGGVDGGLQVSRTADSHPAFFAVYNMETTEIVSFCQNTSEDLSLLFELFCDHFQVSGKNSLYMNYISTQSNNIHALEILRSNKSKSNSSSQFARKMLSSLPFSCQSLSPSPYFDLSLFRYDEKLISAYERHRQATDHPIKFISRRRPNALKFKMKPGPEAGNTDTRAKKYCSFLFHPHFPLALSIQQTLFLQPGVVNIHYRR